MSDTKGFEVSVKEYAAQRGKTVQAVYQQMKRKENAEALEGHVILRYVGNKQVKFLDEVAVTILDAASNSAPIVVVGNELKEELAVANDRIHQLEIAVAMQEGANNTLRELLREKEQELRALAEPQSVIDALTAQNGDLEAERDRARADAQEAQETAQRASDELAATRAELEAIQNKWFFRLFGKLFGKKGVK